MSILPPDATAQESSFLFITPLAGGEEIAVPLPPVAQEALVEEVAANAIPEAQLTTAAVDDLDVLWDQVRSLTSPLSPMSVSPVLTPPSSAPVSDEELDSLWDSIVQVIFDVQTIPAAQEEPRPLPPIPLRGRVSHESAPAA